MAAEKPQLWMDVELGMNHTLGVSAAFAVNVRDAVEHEHRRRRQACITVAKQFTAGTAEEPFAVERERSRHESAGSGSAIESAVLMVAMP